MPYPMTQNYRHIFLALFLCSLGWCTKASAADLKQKTTTAFDHYVSATEARFAGELRPGGVFLYVDGLNAEEKRKAYDQLKNGEILVEKLETKAPGLSTD